MVYLTRQQEEAANIPSWKKAIGTGLKSLASAGEVIGSPQEIAPKLQSAAATVKNVGYLVGSEEKKKKFINDYLDKGFSPEAIMEAMRTLDQQGAFQGDWIDNPVTGTIGNVVSTGLSSAAGVFKGASDVAEGAQKVAESLPAKSGGVSDLGIPGVQAGLTGIAKGALTGGLGMVGIGTSLTPAGLAVNTAFGSDVVAKPIEAVGNAAGEGVKSAQSALGFNPESETSKNIQDIAKTTVPLVALGAAHKVGEPIINPVISKTAGIVKEGTQALSEIPQTTKEIISDIKQTPVKLTKLQENIAKRISQKDFLGSDVSKFEGITGEKPGEFAVSRGMTKTGEEGLAEAAANFEKSKSLADDAFASIDNKYKSEGNGDPVELMLSELVTKSGKTLGKYGDTANDLLNRFTQGEGITMSDINWAKRKYAETHKYSWDQAASDPAVFDKNLQDAVRNYQFAKAKDAGLANIDQINKNTQAWRAYSDILGSRLTKREGNNILTLTDWITLSGGHPENVALFLGKQLGKSKWFKNALIKKFGKQTKEAIIQPTMSDIISKNKERAANNFLRDRGLTGDQQLSLPAPKEGVNYTTPQTIKLNRWSNLGKTGPSVIDVTPRKGTMREITSRSKIVQPKSGRPVEPQTKIEPVKETPKVGEKTASKTIEKKFTREQATEYMNKQIERITKEAKSGKLSKQEAIDQMKELKNDMKYLRMGITPEKLAEGKKAIIEGVTDELLKTEIKTVKTIEPVKSPKIEPKKEVEKKLTQEMMEKEKIQVKKEAEKIKNLPLSESTKKEISVPKEIGNKESLMEEAKKYKSAEDYIKSQGNPVYHGTNADFIEFKKEFRGTATGKTPTNMTSISFTDNPGVAETFGKNIKEVYLDIKNPKIIDVGGVSYSEPYKNYNKFKFFLNDLIEKIDKNKYDSIILKNYKDAGTGEYKLSNHTIVFDESKIKTKSQLTDIWNEANKTEPKMKDIIKKKQK